MSIHERYGLTRVINARGTFTPLGVSRSSQLVGQTVAQALGDFFIMDELHSLVSRSAAAWAGGEAAAVTHCVAAATTISVAAAMAGSDPEKVAALPDARGLPDRVVLPAGHAVDYGHPNSTDIRLAGAVPVLAGCASACSTRDLEAALAHERTACLLLVSSRLTAGSPVDLRDAVAAAHRRGVPAIIDAAAQDMRMDQLVNTGADAVLFSAQKYLASPTAGLIIGRTQFVHDCRAQERGIGRAMKPTKEAILGVLAAIEERRHLDAGAWRVAQARKVAWFVDRVNRMDSVAACEVPDPTGMPFSRVRLTVHPEGEGWNAAVLAARLRSSTPPVWVMEHAASEGYLFLELVPLDEAEVEVIVDRLVLCAAGRSTAAPQSN